MNKGKEVKDEGAETADDLQYAACAPCITIAVSISYVDVKEQMGSKGFVKSEEAS